MVLEHNIGTVDRAVRVIGGLGVFALAFVGPQAPLALLAAIPAATGLVGWCPAYTVLGVKTTPAQDHLYA